MAIRKIVAVIFVGILFVSCYFLDELIVDEKYFIQPTSTPRFVTLLLIHFIVIMYMLIFFKMETFEENMRVAFLLALNLTLMIACTEIYIFRNIYFYSRNAFHDTYSQPLQLIYLNLYFLIYLFASLAVVALGGFLIILCCRRCQRARKIKQMLERSVVPLQYTQQLAGEDCPICLAPFSSDQAITQIVCKHHFHESCLKEWIKANNTCPNCRYNLFSHLNQQELNQARNNQNALQ